MKKYEAMFILRPDLNEDARKTLFNQLGEAISKNGGSITQSSIWTEKKKLYFPLKKHHEGLYYLVNFNSPTEALVKINHAYKLNEDVLRVLITAKE